MNAASERVPEPIVRAAIEWQMRLRDSGSAELYEQLQEWLQRDARHRLAWQRLQQMGGLFQADRLPDAGQSIPLLRRAEADLSRRRTLKLLGFGLLAGSATVLLAQTSPTWRADFATATGERRRISLGAAAEVVLNTGSALDVQGRELILQGGEALIEGADWHARCRFATCQGRNASVLLREHDDYSEIRVQRGEALVSTATGQLRLRGGEGVGVSATGTTTLGKGAIDPFAWARGLLVVSDIRLADFLAEAGRYRKGWLGCDAAVADLHLSGVFRLDEPDAMLSNITHLLPVKIVERTRWWVRVMPVA
ncbi:ferric-dicitrate binding protein FerR, regulates iron transport through sigma-19 [Pseudomonas flavescens]|uniref:Ferric-dicitrate binding protein FerR, regulates iron transport through sigma-19 n=1 Tax=Phytopseudomonas flavescens TaxID=29435 RepID=A0A1G8ATT9_9GAMM|nr:DUF4880 domain-containing protein [Pseudomonas flavescens]SDH24421.1 ferric-dicitrate binding protein FerR, regulates iron transport through sigma-19 [Pseudomonas flavescens]